ncbi:hypothetical protein Hanom_Chr10g00888411 [Helianthus anomalus]
MVIVFLRYTSGSGLVCSNSDSVFVSVFVFGSGHRSSGPADAGNRFRPRFWFSNNKQCWFRFGFGTCSGSVLRSPRSDERICFNPIQSSSMSGFSFKSSLGSGFVNGLARFSFDSVKPSQLGQLLVNSVEQDQLFGTRLGKILMP